MTKILVPALICAALWPSLGLAVESDVEEMRASVAEMKSILADQERRLADMEAKQARDAEYAKLIEELRADVADRPAGPKWMENLKFYGDLRLRYQGECFSGEDRNKKSRNRARFRLRFGFTKTWLDDQLEVGFRLASGEATAHDGEHIGSDPTSTNQTFTDCFSEKSIWIDRAYAKYKPNWLKGLMLVGGKFGVPVVHTNMVWDSDLNIEGVYGEYKHAFGAVEPFAGVGYFIVKESSGGRDVTLGAYQVGARTKLAEKVKWTAAATLYDYDHYDTGYCSAGGNQVIEVDGRDDVLAANFRVFNLTNIVDFQLWNLPMKAYFDWAHNCGSRIDTDEPYNDQIDAYAVGLKVGKNKAKGDWSLGYKYAYIEANAVAGAFNDSDFGHANRKGHVWSGAYNLTDFLTVGGAVLWTEPIVGSSENDRDTTVQADLIWKF